MLYVKNYFGIYYLLQAYCELKPAPASFMCAEFPNVFQLKLVRIFHLYKYPSAIAWGNNFRRVLQLPKLQWIAK